MRGNKGLLEWVTTLREKSNIPARLVLWSGQQYDFGHFEKPSVTIKVNTPTAIPLLLKPSLDNLGEAYVKSKIDIEGKLNEIINFAYLIAKDSTLPKHRILNLFKLFNHSKASDKKAIQYHYDVSNEFYQLWLDPNMVYSCAYFENGDEDLATAQRKKIDHILNKIQLKKDQTLLDIGCGWGALVIRAAQKYGAKCVGITLSQNQFDLATARVKAAGLSDQIEIRLQDYRDVEGQFDRITSVGMFEHVGKKNLPLYFNKMHALLKDEGLAMNHGITSADANSGDTPFGGGDFIDKYVFPDGELPHIGLALEAMQKGGLEALDVENLRGHYAKTLEHWAKNFEENADQAKQLVNDEKFRIWRVYLAGCAYAFEHDNIAIFQILCQKKGKLGSAITPNRRYIYQGKIGEEIENRSS